MTPDRPCRLIAAVPRPTGVGIVTNRRTRALLRDLNREIEEPDWFLAGRRIHPERQISAPLVRTSEAEHIARRFFAEVAADPDLIVRRAQILFQWATARGIATCS